MRVVYEYSHLGGSEIMQVTYPDHLREMYSVITKVHASRSKLSQERTKQGRMLYAPKKMNGEFREAFLAAGYSELRDKDQPG